MVKRRVLRSVALLLIVMAAAVPFVLLLGLAVGADQASAATVPDGSTVTTMTSSCGIGSNTLTTYCPVLNGGQDDESAVMAGVTGAGIVTFGVFMVVGVMLLYKRVASSGLRG